MLNVDPRMNTDDLRDLLREHTTRAPDNPRRYQEIERRVRRIRRRRTAGTGLAGVAAAAAVAMAGGLVGGVNLPLPSGGGSAEGAERSGLVAAKPPPAPVVKPVEPQVGPAPTPQLVPAEQLWPEAVHKLPLTLPNGSPYRPVDFVDKRTLVVTTDVGFEKVGTVWRYDLNANQAHVIAHVPLPDVLDKSRQRNFPDDFTVGAGRVAWWLGYKEKSDYVVEIWSAPLTGGPAKRVTLFRPSVGRGAIWALLAIAGNQVIWSGTGGEVFAAPVTGGQARKLAEADYQLLSWPWVGAPAMRPGNEDDGDPTSGATVYYRVRHNLQTGEQRTSPVVAGTWSCGLDWCLGATEQGDAVRPRASTSARLLPGRGESPTWLVDAPVPLLDRFVPRYTGDGRHYVYDLRTNVGGLLSGDYDKSVSRMHSFPGEQIYFKEFKDHLAVVNLRAIR